MFETTGGDITSCLLHFPLHTWPSTPQLATRSRNQCVRGNQRIEYTVCVGWRRWLYQFCGLEAHPFQTSRQLSYPEGHLGLVLTSDTDEEQNVTARAGVSECDWRVMLGCMHAGAHPPECSVALFGFAGLVTTCPSRCPDRYAQSCPHWGGTRESRSEPWGEPSDTLQAGRAPA